MPYIMAQGNMKADGIFTDVTSQFTIDSNILNTFKAMTDGRTVYFAGRVKKGVGDNTTLITIPSGLRPSWNFLAFATFPLHGVDLVKGATVSYQSGTLVYRIDTPGTGDYGIAFSGSWVIGF